MAFFFSPPLPPPFPAPSLVVHDQCTFEFPLRNASHRKSRLRSERNVACESRRLFRPLFHPPRAEKSSLLWQARRTPTGKSTSGRNDHNSNKTLTVNRTVRLLSLSISFGIPFLSHATRYCSLSVENCKHKDITKCFVHNKLSRPLPHASGYL